MGKILVIAEKPSAGKDIAKALGLKTSDMKNGYMENDKYIIGWAVGSIIDLKNPYEINEDWKKWKLEDLPYNCNLHKELKVSNRKIFKTLKDLIHRKDVDLLINGGDAGREGYLIQKRIYEMAGSKLKEKVLWCQTPTEEAITKCFNNLKDTKDFDSLYYEAIARSELDWKYGMNYTVALTCKLGSFNNTLTYGRCQTPLLNLIVNRDIEIENFIPIPYFQIEAINKDFTLKYIDNIKTKDEAENFIKKLDKKAKITSVKLEDKKETAPNLFSLADLQSHMGKKGYTPTKTLEIAQSLYETHKITTYPRTDSNYITDDIYREYENFIKPIKDNLKSFFGVEPKLHIENLNNKKYVNNGKVSDHFAIIPAGNKDTFKIYNEKLTKEEKEVFFEIAKRSIAPLLDPYIYKSIKIEADINGNKFISQANNVISMGYKEILKPIKNEEDNEKENESTIDKIPKEGDSVDISKFNILDKMTEKPKQYTTSSINDLMKKYRIGTSATRPSIIDKLIDKDFIKLNKSKYVSTEKGREFIKILPDFMKDISLLEKVENRLEEVNKGTKTLEEFTKESDKEILETLKKINMLKGDVKNMAEEKKEKKVIGKCPVCGKDVVENAKGWGCSGYSKDDPNSCKFFIGNEFYEGKVSEEEAKELLTNKKTKGKIKNIKSSKGSHYDSYLKLDENNKVRADFDRKD